MIIDVDTEEQLGDVTGLGQRLLVAKGGKGGWGNTQFKSSTNRTPRKAMPGLPGEKRELRLELKVMADVGLLGLPNAGKSTLIRAVSAAKPKVADYPFTTLHPNLGVVAVGIHRSFVMADIPGLIEGAAEGAGLGIRFLKHLQRTRVLLHLIDIAPPDPDADPVQDARSIVAELKKFSADLAKKERWLVLNKLDLLPPDEAEQALQGHRPSAALEGAGLSDFGAGAAGHGGAVPRHHEAAGRVGGAGAGGSVGLKPDLQGSHSGSRRPRRAQPADISLTRAFRWLLWRDALLRWMTPLFTAESMIGPAAFSFAAASSLLPALTALTTPLMAVRSLERAATLRARRLMV